MSTKFLLAKQQKKANPLRTLQHDALIPVRGVSHRMEYVHASFDQSSVKPGGKCSVEIKFNSKEIELDRAQLIRFQMNTSDGTNHATMMKDAYTLIDQISVEYNNSREKLEYVTNTDILCARSFTLKEYGDEIMEHLASTNVNFNSLAGVQVTNAASQNFYINIFDLFPHLKDQVHQGFINEMKVSIRFTPAATDAANTGHICVSNTAANPYTTASVSFTNIEFIRAYDIIQDQDSFFRPALDSVRLVVPKFTTETYDGIAWNVVGTNKVSFKISDLAKETNVVGVLAYVRDVGASPAYNDANAGKMYSGHNYITWSLKQLTGDKKTLSFLTDTTEWKRRLRNYEIETQYNEYAGKKLPISVHANTDDLNKYYLVQTWIPLQNIMIESGAYDVLSGVNTSTVDDWEVTFQCAGAVDAVSDLVVQIVHNDVYAFDKMRQLNKLN